MNDTSAQIAKKYNEMLMSKSGAERMEMASSMHETARQLILSRYKDNDLSNIVKFKEFLLESFYGNELSDVYRKKVIEKIKSRSH